MLMQSCKHMSNSTVCHPNVSIFNCYQSLQLWQNAKGIQSSLFLHSIASMRLTFFEPRVLGLKMFVCVYLKFIVTIGIFGHTQVNQIFGQLFIFSLLFVIKSDFFLSFFFHFQKKNINSFCYSVDWCLKEKHYSICYPQKICWLGVFLFATTTTK